MSQWIVIAGSLLVALGCGYVVAGSMNLALRPDAMATKLRDTCRRGENGLVDEKQMCYGVMENADSERFVTIIHAQAGDRLPADGSVDRYAYGDTRVRSARVNRRFLHSSIGIAVGIAYLLMGVGALHVGLRGTASR